jgi:3-dehydroquinate dehydratase-2
MILIINGPNLNLLGQREPEIYGFDTYQTLVETCTLAAAKLNIEITIKQTNHEGEIIDLIQGANTCAKGLIINPGGYSHTSIAILDALKFLNIPIIEVHLTDIKKREHFRQQSLTALAAKEVIMGKGIDGYTEAINKMVNLIY